MNKPPLTKNPKRRFTRNPNSSNGKRKEPPTLPVNIRKRSKESYHSTDKLPQVDNSLEDIPLQNLTHHVLGAVGALSNEAKSTLLTIPHGELVDMLENLVKRS
jgi:hypothetical protein